MVWQKFPFKFEVKAGEVKAICACGETKNPPFCDGSHAGTGIGPRVVKFTEDKRVSICGCGASKTMPFCDGAHKLLKDE